MSSRVLGGDLHEGVRGHRRVVGLWRFEGRVGRKGGWVCGSVEPERGHPGRPRLVCHLLTGILHLRVLGSGVCTRA